LRVHKNNPFKYFKTPHEIIRLAVMYYVRYPLSFRQVEASAPSSRPLPMFL
jgi:transposase-like protein